MSKSRATKQIDNDVERAMTFNNLQKELFKDAAELSTLTGARIAIVLESEDRKVYSFGTPSAASVIDNFLSGNPCMDLGGEQNANTMQLQSQVVELERDVTEVKEMGEATEKVGNEYPHVQVAPQMPASHTSLVHLARVLYEGVSVGADRGYEHDVGSPGTNQLNWKPFI